MRTLILAVVLGLAALLARRAGRGQPGRRSCRSRSASSPQRTSKGSARSPAPVRRTASASSSGSRACGAGAELIPGIDIAGPARRDHARVSRVKFGDAAIDGDVATVPVTGSAKVTFDEVRMRPLVKAILERSEGQPMSDDQLDSLLKTLATYGQDVPIESRSGSSGRAAPGRSARSRSRFLPRPDMSARRHSPWPPDTCRTSVLFGRPSGRLDPCPRIESSCAARANTT